MKFIAIFFVLFYSISYAQNRDSLVDKGYVERLRKSNNRQTFSDLFFSEMEDGIYCGVTNHFELLTYAIGGELKFYESYYSPFFSGSVYLNQRHLFNSETSSIPSNVTSIGIHFTIFGLEANCYYNKASTLLYLTPKIGYDRGNFSIFYGYSLPLNHSTYTQNYGHSISVKLELYLSAFKYHRMRRESDGY